MKKINFITVWLALIWSTSALANVGVSDLAIFQNGTSVPKVAQDRELAMVFATWCGECKDKINNVFPDLVKQGVRVTLIATDRDEKKLREYLNKYQVNFPVVWDRDRSFRKEHRLFSVPSWVVFENQSKTILSMGSGFEEDKIRDLLQVKR